MAVVRLQNPHEDISLSFTETRSVDGFRLRPHIPLFHLHLAVSVSENDGVGYSFSLRAESEEIEDARVLFDAYRHAATSGWVAGGPALCLRTAVVVFAVAAARIAVAISPIQPL